jgi:hypothetical protein
MYTKGKIKKPGGGRERQAKRLINLLARKM